MALVSLDPRMSHGAQISQIPLELWDVISSPHGAAFNSPNFMFANFLQLFFEGLWFIHFSIIQERKLNRLIFLQ